jgi:hypothetical protein
MHGVGGRWPPIRFFANRMRSLARLRIARDYLLADFRDAGFATGSRPPT